MGSLVEEFHTKGPCSSNISSADALENIANLRKNLTALKEQEATLRRGLGIFKIDQPPSKEIAKLEQVSSSAKAFLKHFQY